jgi:CDP-diglyceride synthetase
MNTVGYGDIVPISAKEKIFTVFMTIIACGFFAYCVMIIGNIFQSMANREAEIK